MKEVLEEDQSSKMLGISNNSEGVDVLKNRCVLSEEYKKQLIERIENDESLDPDTKKNAITAVNLYSVDCSDAIKIAEIVNLLWEGKKKFDYNEDDIYVYKTNSRDGIFIEKLFPLAKKYKDIETVDAIPKEVLENVFEFKNNYWDELALDEIKKDDKKLKLYDFVAQKIKSLDHSLENNKDSEWREIAEKLDLVNVNIIDLREKKFIEVKIVKALSNYEEKQNNIQERKENGFGIRGFEKCEQISKDEVENFLVETFGEELLPKALISEVVYSSKFRIGDKEGSQAFLSEDNFLRIKEYESDLENRRFLGASSEDYKEAAIVDVYNHKYRDASQYSFLKDFSDDKQKLRALILGTLTHEIAGHRFYNAVLKLSERKEFERICEEENQNNVTVYAKRYKEKELQGNFYDEDFSDSMRRFMTDYEDFKKEFPQRVEFIEKKFPEIIKDGISKFIENKQ